VRENTEGEYFRDRRAHLRGHGARNPWCSRARSRPRTDRILKYAFELARQPPEKHLTSGDQVNGISITMPIGIGRVAPWPKLSEVKTDQYHIDILTAHFVQHPDWLTWWWVRTCSATSSRTSGRRCTGTIGIAPSGNINPERKYPSVFEPVHGSAPDI